MLTAYEYTLIACKMEQAEPTILRWRKPANPHTCGGEPDQALTQLPAKRRSPRVWGVRGSMVEQDTDFIPSSEYHGQMVVPLAKLRTDSTLQVRATSETAIRGLAETNEGQWPPIVVAIWADHFLLQDGHHRVAAARRKGLSSLRAVVVPEATQRGAYEANVAHGQPLTTADKKEYARLLHRDFPTASFRELARRTGLDRATIQGALDSAPASSPAVGEHTAPVLAGPKRNDPAYWEGRIKGGLFAYARKRGAAKKGRAEHISRERLSEDVLALLTTKAHYVN